MRSDLIIFNISALDSALKGGIPYGSDILLKAKPGAPKDIILKSYLTEGLNRGDSCWVISTFGYQEDMLALPENKIKEYESKGKLIFIDAFSNPYNDKDVKPHGEYHLSKLNDLDVFRKEVRKAVEDMKPEHSRGVIDSASYIMNTVCESEEIEFIKYLHRQKVLVKDFNASVLYSINPNTIKEMYLGLIEEMVDCIINLDRTQDGMTIQVEKLNGHDFDHKPKNISIKNK